MNSGRATRERNIEETALKTNLEAADEAARQMRLRDLAGLIVIDFIDMEEGRNQRAVEKRLKDALKADRARVQMGRISQFGLMELSRQRLRASLQELSSQICPHCAGLGVVRSTESCALQTLRAIQEHGIRGEAAALTLTAPPEVALYLLNQKREALSRLEHSYTMRVLVLVNSSLVPPATRLEVTEKRDRERERERVETAHADRVETPEEPPEEVAAEEPRRQRKPVQAAAGPQQPRPPVGEEGEEGLQRRRRKRRRRRRRPGDAGPSPELHAAESLDQPSAEADEDHEEFDEVEPALAAEPQHAADVDQPAESAAVARSRVRGCGRVCARSTRGGARAARRGGGAGDRGTRRGRRRGCASAAEPVAEEPAKPAKPARPRRPRKPKAAGRTGSGARRGRRTGATRARFGRGRTAPAQWQVGARGSGPGGLPAPEPAAAELVAGDLAAPDDEDRPQRQGWWSRWVR